MKRRISILVMVLIAAMVFVSCNNEPGSYTVRFDSSGGTEVQEQIVAAHGKAEKPADPKRDGFSFLGWYIDNAKFEFETTEIKADITLKAKWGVTVTFNTDGGSDIAPVVVEENKTLTKPDNPTKTGLIFNYWTKDGTSEFDLSTPLTENITLKALWRDYYIVGDIGPAGGIIFYDCDADNEKATNDGLNSSTCGWRYLEISASDLSKEVNGSAVTKFIFGYYRTSDSGSNQRGTDNVESGIGKGNANTTALTSAMGSEAYSSSNGSDKTSYYAAKLCADYEVTYNGEKYDDWFLPSEDELKAAYTNLKSVSGMTFGRESYWTSTAYDGSEAKTVSFYNGGSGQALRGDDPYKIRPVRVFK